MSPGGATDRAEHDRPSPLQGFSLQPLHPEAEAPGCGPYAPSGLRRTAQDVQQVSFATETRWSQLESELGEGLGRTRAELPFVVHQQDLDSRHVHLPVA